MEKKSTPNSENYNFKLTEQKWQKIWHDDKVFEFKDDDKRKKFYVLEMFPYPSGELHVGHLLNFTIGDVIARFRRMQGYNVLHPMGADAFGLPAENAAIKRKINPSEWTKDNVEHFIKSMKRLGLSYDFSRFFATCFPEYYGKQQEIFIDMYKKGLIYRKESFVNWDPVDQTVLANEQVIDGKGWRSGAVIEKKKLNQWFFKITNYAEELLNDIDDKLQGWTDKVKTMQKNWIGKSEGALVDFKLTSSDEKITVYTTRPDTLFGASFIGISPDHEIARNLSKNNAEIDTFVKECQKTSVDEETISTMEKKGIFTGLYVEHPFDKKLTLPVYIANFILMDYGTGAIFACPAHDERDYEFAIKYNLPIKKVVECETLPFTENGIVINSDFLNGLNTKEAKKKAIEKLRELKSGEQKINYRLRDWSFSRQRYWGCPIPIVYCPHCGVVHLEKKDLPLKLPEDVVFDGKGNPLDKHPTWKYVKCPHCGAEALRETDTMDTFVDSSWYFLRFVDTSEERAINGELCDKIMPIDQYVGGIEHATGHLMYARFFTKALRDCGYFKIDEPAKKLFNQGLLCHRAYRGKTTKEWCYPQDVIKKNEKFYNSKTNEELSDEGVIKMSKSKSNVVDIERAVDIYGADGIRLSILSDTPADKDIEWSDDVSVSCWKYLNKIYKNIVAFNKKYSGNYINGSKYKNEIIRYTHKVIKDVSNNLENMEFNRAIARLRELSNYFEKIELNSEENVDSYFFAVVNFLKMLSPFAPHLCSEMFEILKINDISWPNFDETLTIDNVVVVAIQVNGKLRGTIEVQRGSEEEEIKKLALKEKSVEKYLEGKNIKKVIVIKDKMASFVV
jgi:leucyl-tRNA synthetase